MRFTLSILLFCLSCLSVLADSASDPWFQMVTYQTNIYRLHGTIFMTGDSGSNYFISTTREDPYNQATNCYLNIHNSDNITNFYSLLLETNRHQAAASLCSIKGQAYVFVTDNVGSFFSVTRLNPDNRQVTDIVSFTNTGFLPGKAGAIATDGTNLVAVGLSVVAKFDTNGTILATNSFSQSFTTNFWVDSAHEVIWDGTNYLVTGNLIDHKGTNGVLVVAQDLSYTSLSLIPTNINCQHWQSTDDAAFGMGWLALANEGGAYNGTGNGVEAFMRTDGTTIGVNTGINASINLGMLWDGQYFWGIWTIGYLSKLDPKELPSGVVRVDNYTIGPSVSPGIGSAPGTGLGVGINELVVDTNHVPPLYYATDFLYPYQGVSHAYRFSAAGLYHYNTVWSITNGTANNPFILFRIK